MRDTLVAILEQHGYRVSSAPDGETAFSAVQQTAFDVVVMDIQMPGRDGVSVLQEIGVPPPRVILMTAYALEARLRAAVKAEAFAILHKPFDTRRMLSLVADASHAGRCALCRLLTHGLARRLSTSSMTIRACGRLSSMSWRWPGSQLKVSPPGRLRWRPAVLSDRTWRSWICGSPTPRGSPFRPG